MSYVFISHVEEDAATARELAGGLEEAGYTAWFYERDSLPGPPYVTQILEAIGQSTVMMVLVSPATLGSWQVDREIFQAFETGKHMIPLLIGIIYEELRNRRQVHTCAFPRCVCHVWISCAHEFSNSPQYLDWQNLCHPGSGMRDFHVVRVGSQNLV